MKIYKKGMIDYDLDRYCRKIRKFVVTGMTKVHGKQFPVWDQVLDFRAEIEIPKHKVEVMKQRW
jgi:hypothetical protein